MSPERRDKDEEHHTEKLLVRGEAAGWSHNRTFIDFEMAATGLWQISYKIIQLAARLLGADVTARRGIARRAPPQSRRGDVFCTCLHQRLGSYCAYSREAICHEVRNVFRADRAMFLVFGVPIRALRRLICSGG
jgi:hypothetical protein